MTVIPERLELLDRLVLDESFALAFWSRVDRSSDCWEWLGTRARNGYGRFRCCGLDMAAHRVAVALESGVTPPVELDVCHHCDNRGCVNPAHLYVGTRRQNMADCTARGRHNKPRGERHWCAVLSADDVREMRRLTDEGWTRKDLGERYSVNAATVSRIVRGIWRQEVA